jgi:hypothetical protein
LLACLLSASSLLPRASGGADAIGGDFDFVHALEGEEQLDQEFWRLLTGLANDVADGVGDGGVEEHALHLQAGEIDAYHLSRLKFCLWLRHCDPFICATSICLPLIILAN